MAVYLSISPIHRYGNDDAGRRETQPRSYHGFEGGDAPLAGRRVLIVEDEAMLAFALQLAFEDAGAVVAGPFHTLESAQVFVTAEGETIDGAVLDVDLGGKDVTPVAERLTAMGVPIVFHTGHGNREALVARFPGAVVCMKPTLSDSLIWNLARLLDE